MKTPSHNPEACKTAMLPWGETLVIIPTYNEIDNVPLMVSTLAALYPELSLLIVDDSSPDGTAQAVEEMLPQNPRLHLIKRAGKQGLASAYLCGFQWALERNYNYIFEMDCDFSHDPKQMPDLLSAAQTHHLAIGSRYINGLHMLNWSLYRLSLSYLATLYIRLITGLPLSDPTGGFKCFTRQALEALDLEQVFAQGYIFQLELNYKLSLLGFAIKEVPITFNQRRAGQSKLSLAIIVEALLVVLKLRWYALTGALLKKKADT